MPILNATQIRELQQYARAHAYAYGGDRWAAWVSAGVQLQAVYDTGGPQGEAGYDTPAPLHGFIAYPAGQNAPGQLYDAYDPGGNYLGSAQFQAVRDGDLLLMFALAVGGMMLLPGGLLSGGALGGGPVPLAESLAPGESLVGETLSKAALDGTTAFGANSVPGAFDLAAWEAGLSGTVGATSMAGSTMVSSAAGTIGSIAGTVGKVAGAVAGVLGLTGATGGTGAGGQSLQYGPGQPSAQPQQPAGGGDLVALALIGAAAYFALG